MSVNLSIVDTSWGDINMKITIKHTNNFGNAFAVDCLFKGNGKGFFWLYDTLEAYFNDLVEDKYLCNMFNQHLLGHDFKVAKRDDDYRRFTFKDLNNDHYLVAICDREAQRVI